MKSGVFRWRGVIIQPIKKDRRKGRIMRKPGQNDSMVFDPEVMTASHWLLASVGRKEAWSTKERQMSWRC